MAVDLHLHSVFSDGTATPEEIVATAAEIGLTGIALTDHDTLEGIPLAAAAADALAVGFIGGTELSVQWRGRTMHLLVYFLQPGPGPLQDRLEALRRAREDRNHQIVGLLQKVGIEISMAEVAAEAGRGVVGRPHFAGVMMNKGYVESVAEAFDHYLAAGRPAYAPRKTLEAGEAITLARESAAVPVVAHPHTVGLRASEVATGLQDLVRQGLGGMESYYGEYSPEMRHRLSDICDELGIVATGGSDYHGRYKPDLQIGVGRGDLRVPDEVLDRLVAAR